MKKLFAALLAITMILSSTVLCVTADGTDATTPTGSWSDENNYDTSWYNAENTTHTVSNAAELAGLAVLVDGIIDEEATAALKNDDDPDNDNDIVYSNAPITFAGETINVVLDEGLTEINLSAHYWEPIGSGATPFQGVFDGKDVTVSGMIVLNNSTTDDLALFAVLSSTSEQNATPALRNFSLVNSSVETSSADYPALVVGMLYTNQPITLTLENIYAEGTVTSTKAVSRMGGVCGIIQANNADATVNITNVVSNVNVNANGSRDSNAGGISGAVANNMPCTINMTNCVNLGTISSVSTTSARGRVGGMIGWSGCKNAVNFDSCLNLGTVSKGAQPEEVGAIIGFVGQAVSVNTVKNCVFQSGISIFGSKSGINDNEVYENNYAIDATENGTGYTAIGADQINVFSNILDTASALTGYENVEKTLTGLVTACNAVAKTGGLCALQLSTVKEAAEGNTYSVRFIAKLDSTDGYARAGVDVTINGVTKTMYTNSVYEEISAYTENGTIESYTAETLGAEFLYAVGVYNIPVDADVVITVTPFTTAVVAENETLTYGEGYEITLSNGAYVGCEKVEAAA